MRAPSLAISLVLGTIALIGCGVDRHAALPFGESDATCARCHAQADDFAQSAHASAGRSEVMRALLPHVETAWGSAARDRCVACHAPPHVAGDPEEDTAALDDGVDHGPDGIACISCHAAVGNRGTFDGRLVVDPSAPLDGPFDDPEETPAHRSARRGFVSDATSCLTCHDVRGPGLFVEPTAMEHDDAIAAVDAPSCATCHMPALPEGPIADGASRDRPRRSHRFVGPTPPRERSEAAWAEHEASLRALFADRVTLEVVVEGGAAHVVVANVGAGHAVPTGVTFLRALDVELEIDGARTVTAISLGDRPMRGEEAVVLPTDADRLERRRIDPGDHVAATVPLMAGEHRVEARLVLRAYRSEILDALGLDPGLSRPVTVLSASAEAR